MELLWAGPVVTFTLTSTEPTVGRASSKSRTISRPSCSSISFSVASPLKASENDPLQSASPVSVTNCTAPRAYPTSVASLLAVAIGGAGIECTGARETSELACLRHEVVIGFACVGDALEASIAVASHQQLGALARSARHGALALAARHKAERARVTSIEATLICPKPRPGPSNYTRGARCGGGWLAARAACGCASCGAGGTSRNAHAVVRERCSRSARQAIAACCPAASVARVVACGACPIGREAVLCVQDAAGSAAALASRITGEHVEATCEVADWGSR
eukprot:scaffold54828_cov30-Tisochrysis_lutea.AAC.3